MTESVQPKTTPSGNLHWVKHGDTHVQLFRDIYFGRYIPSTKTTDIHSDPDREYSKYNKQTITRKVKDIRAIVDTFREFGTGLNDEGFKSRLKLNNPPDATENKGRTTEVADDEENGGDEMNVDDDEEKPFYSPPTKQKSSKADPTDKPDKAEVPQSEETISGAGNKTIKNNQLDYLNVVPYPDGRYYVKFEIPRGSASPSRLKLEFAGSSSIQVYIRRNPAFYKPALLLEGMTAVDDFDPAANIHYAALNNEITRELTALGLTFRDVENDNLPWVQIAEISFEKEVEPFFLDASGNKVEKPYVNGCSEDIIWTTFWVVQKGYSFYSQQSDDLVFVGRAKKTPSTGASAVQSGDVKDQRKKTKLNP